MRARRSRWVPYAAIAAVVVSALCGGVSTVRAQSLPSTVPARVEVRIRVWHDGKRVEPEQIHLSSITPANVCANVAGWNKQAEYMARIPAGGTWAVRVNASGPPLNSFGEQEFRAVADPEGKLTVDVQLRKYSTLRGTVLAADTRKPLENMTISIAGRDAAKRSQSTVLSNVKGEFVVENLPGPGTYEIRARGRDYDSTEAFEVEVGEQAEVMLNIPRAMWVPVKLVFTGLNGKPLPRNTRLDMKTAGGLVWQEIPESGEVVLPMCSLGRATLESPSLAAQGLMFLPSTIEITRETKVVHIGVAELPEGAQKGQENPKGPGQ